MDNNSCPSCNQPVPPDTDFCPNCGQYLGVVEKTLKTPPPAEQEPGSSRTEPSPKTAEQQIPGTIPSGEMPGDRPIPPTVPSGGPPADTERIAGDQFVCPYCGQLHRFGLNFCPMTGEPLEAPETVPMPEETVITPPPPPPSAMRQCPHCGNPVQASATFCPSCGNSLALIKPQPPTGEKSNNWIWWVVVVVLLLIGCSIITALAYYFSQQEEQPLAYIESIISGLNPLSSETSNQTPEISLPTISASDTPIEIIISASSTSTDTPAPLQSATETFTPSPTWTSPPIMQYDLAFSSNLDGQYKIYVVDLENPQEWVSLHQPQNASRAWHPTFCGEWVAAEIAFSNGLTQWIHLLNMEDDTPLGGNAAPERSRELGTPDCAHDSGYMAYSWKAARWVVKVVDLNTGSQVREYTPGENHYFLHPFLPDSFRIYFVDQNLGSGQFKINEASLNSTTYSIKSPALADGKAIEKALYPATNKDMTQIAFTCLLSGQNQFGLCITNMGSTQASVLVPNIASKKEDDNAPGAPAWSEDGQYIYFSYNRSGQYDIYRVDVLTGYTENITNTPGSNELMPAIRWNP